MNSFDIWLNDFIQNGMCNWHLSTNKQFFNTEDIYSECIDDCLNDKCSCICWACTHEGIYLRDECNFA